MTASEKKALEKLEKLHEEIEELNNTQRAASYTLDTLATTVQDIDIRIGQVFPGSDIILVYGSQGYYNWHIIHTKILNQHWKKLSEFITFCGAIERCECIDGKRPDMNEKVIVNKDTRFPDDSKDELYINVRSTSVLTKMLYIDEMLKNMNMESRRGLMKHFLDFIKNDIYTRTSFEEKHNLTWIERRGY